ncbi:MAG: hypothetical protein RR177_01650 [Oscillospiraceae bacterium]
MKARGKKTLAMLLAMIMVVCLASVGASAADTYTPNRSMTVRSVSAQNPIVQMEMIPFNMGENGGPYHLFGKVKIENFQIIDTAKPAAASIVAYYGNRDSSNNLKDPDKTDILRSWTADTNGWIDMTLEDGRHMELNNFEDDVILRFSMENAKGSFTFADFIIADKTNAIVYSLANDSQFCGITSYWSRLGIDHLWTPYNINNADAFVDVQSNIKYEYTPNNIMKLSIPANGAGVSPIVNGYVSTRFSTTLAAEKAPFTLRGMMKIENFAVNTSDLNFAKQARFFTGHDMGRVFCGDTDGWVPMLKPNGEQYTIASALDFQSIFGSWGSTGDFSLADLEVLDNDGKVVYSFKDDTTTTVGRHALASTLEYLHLWYGFNGGSDGFYEYSKAQTPVDHTAAEYTLKTVSETYTPYKEKEEDKDDGKTDPPTTEEELFSIKAAILDVQYDAASKTMTIPKNSTVGQFIDAIELKDGITMKIQSGENEIVERAALMTADMQIKLYKNGVMAETLTLKIDGGSASPATGEQTAGVLMALLMLAGSCMTAAVMVKARKNKVR